MEGRNPSRAFVTYHLPESHVIVSLALAGVGKIRNSLQLFPSRVFRYLHLVTQGGLRHRNLNISNDLLIQTSHRFQIGKNMTVHEDGNSLTEPQIIHGRPNIRKFTPVILRHLARLEWLQVCAVGIGALTWR